MRGLVQTTNIPPGRYRETGVASIKRVHGRAQAGVCRSSSIPTSAITDSAVVIVAIVYAEVPVEVDVASELERKIMIITMRGHRLREGRSVY